MQGCARCSCSPLGDNSAQGQWLVREASIMRCPEPCCKLSPGLQLVLSSATAAVQLKQSL